MENPRDVNPPPAQTTLCHGGCGFYGSPATDGLCSKCFKESLKRKQEVPGRLSPNTSVSSMGGSDPYRPSVSFPISDPILPKLEREEREASTSRDKKKESTPTPAAQPEVPPPTKVEGPSGPDGKGDTAPGGDAAKSGEGETGTEAPPPGTKKKNRCHACNKKVGLTGFNCRCGGLFCGIHRYSDMHKCSFDYKKLGEEEIRKNNPVVAAEKIQKI